RTPPVRLNKVPIGILPLGILVQVLHVGVGGGAVDVEVIFLYVFAMVSFAIGQSEQALFQDGVPAVPQRQGEAKLLLVVGKSGQTVLAPVVSARTRLVVREIVPGIAVLAVIFAYRAPLAFTE